MRFVRAYVHSLAGLALLFLTGCGNELNTPGETLRILAETLEPAYLNEEYSADIRTIGGLPPYTYELDDGVLPPGIALQGGTLRGVATTEGSYSFTITVSDGNLSKTFQDYDLSVVPAPPAELSLNVPQTQVQGPVLLRAEVKNVRDLQGFRTLIEWDPQLFTFRPESLRSRNANYGIFYSAEEGNLQVDVAILGASLNQDRRVFEFELLPKEPSSLDLRVKTEFLSGNNVHAYSDVTEGLQDTPLPEEPLEEFPEEEFPEGEFPEGEEDTTQEPPGAEGDQP